MEADMESAIRQHGVAAKWEQFAEKDPFAYIMTDLANASHEAFWQSGERTVKEELLPFIEEAGVRRDMGLEIGCGVGRLVLPLSQVFRQMVGVDISRGMVRRAADSAREHGVTNARFLAVAAPNDLLGAIPEAVGQVTFLYSLLVFQHIQDFHDVESYFAAARRLLHHDGVAYLQFDTRPQTFAYHVKTAAPDFMLPKLLRRGIRRVRRKTAEIERALARNGLQVVRELTPATAYHRYVVCLG
jgi:cyclopropane fatty-acyl-phospholipid synthase-like methyltransferase